MGKVNIPNEVLTCVVKMSSVRSLLFLPGEVCQYMSHRFVILIQKAFEVCRIVCH
jgi:hypothetical protein